jgi:hypothetical protein
MAKVGYGRAIARAGWKIWGIALLELVVVAGISLLPLILGALRQLLPLKSTVTVGTAFGRAFLSGQLMFYAIGLIATITWFCNKDRAEFFPLRTVFNLYSLFGISLCSLFVGYDPELRTINPAFLAPASVSVFVITLSVYAVISVISEVDVDVGKDLAQSDADLTAAVLKSRGLK